MFKRSWFESCRWEFSGLVAVLSNILSANYTKMLAACSSSGYAMRLALTNSLIESKMPLSYRLIKLPATLWLILLHSSDITRYSNLFITSSVMFIESAGWKLASYSSHPIIMTWSCTSRLNMIISARIMRSIILQHSWSLFLSLRFSEANIKSWLLFWQATSESCCDS